MSSIDKRTGRVCRRLANLRPIPCFQLAGVKVISFLFVLMIVLVIGSLPAWPYSRNWGYYPSGLVGLILMVLIVMAISGRL
jgi:hypothetical protein